MDQTPFPTAGATPVSSIRRVSIASVKFETPIERSDPRSRSSIIARHVSTYLSTRGFGQWMSETSMRSSPMMMSDSFVLARASSKPCERPGIFVVTTSSSRSIPLRRIASPTSASFS